MKIVITGANSFIGKRLAKKAEKYGWETVLVMRSEHVQGESVPNGRILLLHMAEYARLGELAGPCDCFVHLAWSGTRGDFRMDASRQKANLEYSLQGVRSMLAAGCGRIVTAGSQAEYGPHEEQISEESLCVPNTEYGKAKLEFFRKTAELCAASRTACIEPRFFSLYGPGDFAGTMIISILRDMLVDRPCKLTAGIQMWDFLHIDDAVNALAALCDAPCPDGVYNFGSGDVRRLRDYVEEMAAITQTKSPLLFGAVPYPKTGMVSLWPDVSKLKRELHWEPRIAFADGIRSILDTMNRGGET